MLEASAIIYSLKQLLAIICRNKLPNTIGGKDLVANCHGHISKIISILEF